MLRNFWIGLTLWMLGATAQASVVYNWSPLSEGDKFSVLSGRLVFATTNYTAGWANGVYTANYDNHAESITSASSPVVEFTLQFMADYYPLSARVLPREGGESNPVLYELDVSNIDFIDNFLTGSLALLTSESMFSMSADSTGLWEVGGFASDLYAGGSCGGYPLCEGALGRWELDISTIPVPGPSTITLLFLFVAVPSMFVAARYSNSRRGHV